MLQFPEREVADVTDQFRVNISALRRESTEKTLKRSNAVETKKEGIRRDCDGGYAYISVVSFVACMRGMHL